jgi:hypothetical protein
MCGGHLAFWHGDLLFNSEVLQLEGNPHTKFDILGRLFFELSCTRHFDILTFCGGHVGFWHDDLLFDSNVSLQCTYQIWSQSDTYFGVLTKCVVGILNFDMVTYFTYYTSRVTHIPHLNILGRIFFELSHTRRFDCILDFDLVHLLFNSDALEGKPYTKYEHSWSHIFWVIAHVSLKRTQTWCEKPTETIMPSSPFGSGA